MVSVKRSSEHNLGTHKVEERGDSYIPQLTIDTLSLKFCDLIMLDVERYELNVLKGAMGTIHKFNPVIFAECGQRVQEFMGKLGYKNVGVSASDTIFIREMEETINTP
jgi:hypothetical protein